MADENPTGHGDAVSLTISPDDAKFLRGIFTAARSGVRDELAAYPKRLRKPPHLRREEVAYGRLLGGLDTRSIVPDRDTRDVLADLATVIDSGNEYSRVVAEHKALHDLLAQLAEGGER